VSAEQREKLDAAAPQSAFQAAAALDRAGQRLSAYLK